MGAVARVGVTAALILGAAACGGDGGGGSDPDNGATTLTIYSSLPLRGPSAAQSESIVNAEKLALQAAGGRVGKFIVKYVSLDDSSGPAGWEPKAVSAAARRAAQDLTAIGYLGDLDSGASAISIPVTNEAGILQISPSNTAVGLTRSEGAGKGEPEKYYPSGKRTFGRVMPADHVQAAAQVIFQQDEDCSATFLLDDGQFDGVSIADQVAVAAGQRGLKIAGEGSIDPEAADNRTAVQEVVDSDADCVFFGGGTQSSAVRLFTDLHAALPQATLFGSDGVAETAFTRALEPAVARKVRLTTPMLDPDASTSAARAFSRRYRAAFGRAPDPLAVYGYEAMQLMLLAIRGAGDDADDKQAVIDAFFMLKERDTALGGYAIDERGDTTLTAYGTATVKDGEVAFRKVIDTGSAQ